MRYNVLYLILFVLSCFANALPARAETVPGTITSPAAPSQRQLFLPLIRQANGVTDTRRGPITSGECTAIGGKLTEKSYDNNTSFVEIDKRRRYLPRATEGLNARFFSGGVIDSRTGSSPVCYFPGNYIIVWPNPSGPATDEDLKWFVDNPGKIVYLEFPSGRPEVDMPKVSASGQTTETLYSMIIAPVATFVGDIPIVGNVRVGGQTTTKLLQIGEIGTGRLATMVRAGGYAYVLSVFLDRIWTSTTLGATVGAADLGGDAFYVPKTKTNVNARVYVWYHADVVTEYDKRPIGDAVGLLLPENGKNWGWLYTTKPQFEGHKSVFSFDNIIDFSTHELVNEKQESIPTDVATLEAELEELNDYADRRLRKKEVPADPTQCGPQNGVAILAESMAWLSMFSASGHEDLNAETARFLLEYVVNATFIVWETRYAKPAPWRPIAFAQEFATHPQLGKVWAVYTVCSMMGGLVPRPAFTFGPASGGFWGISNDIDTPKLHVKYPVTE